MDGLVLMQLLKTDSLTVNSQIIQNSTNTNQIGSVFGPTFFCFFKTPSCQLELFLGQAPSHP